MSIWIGITFAVMFILPFAVAQLASECAGIAGSSNLSRERIWCLNIGLRKSTFQHLFGEIPQRPGKGKIVDMQYDFTAVNTLFPHPVYAWMAWVRILNPSEESFEHILPLIQEAYEYAKDKYRNRRI